MRLYVISGGTIRMAARRSAQQLVQVAAEEDALLLFGHDAAQWQTLRLSPLFYD
jgi:hypothetical protein